MDLLTQIHQIIQKTLISGQPHLCIKKLHDLKKEFDDILENQKQKNLELIKNLIDIGITSKEIRSMTKQQYKKFLFYFLSKNSQIKDQYEVKLREKKFNQQIWWQDTIMDQEIVKKIAILMHSTENFTKVNFSNVKSSMDLELIINSDKLEQFNQYHVYIQKWVEKQKNRWIQQQQNNQPKNNHRQQKMFEYEKQQLQKQQLKLNQINSTQNFQIEQVQKKSSEQQNQQLQQLNQCDMVMESKKNNESGNNNQNQIRGSKKSKILQQELSVIYSVQDSHLFDDNSDNDNEEIYNNFKKLDMDKSCEFEEEIYDDEIFESYVAQQLKTSKEVKSIKSSIQQSDQQDSLITFDSIVSASSSINQKDIQLNQKNSTNLKFCYCSSSFKNQKMGQKQYNKCNSNSNNTISESVKFSKESCSTGDLEYDIEDAENQLQMEFMNPSIQKPYDFKQIQYSSEINKINSNKAL
ncbi:hypothetical protein PPERSA_04021 [Pseudocohnilembus persalinus]|uniref:Uncharacterized protein n=1 Tax=Pseudocohnilembus persalinus TaxID=266149 RepID=A0A0V0QKR9_PSEPJ|nr:hypothetical protein PPERSA_04021 [Pseudocohnilembus persalinus]|eukprot:KRX02818.1 hypothetical protein PPERSA_04021 [Pseudocohnilembus persalinus]